MQGMIPRQAGQLLTDRLNVSDEEALLSRPWVGASWEGFVIEQVINVLSVLGERFDAYHFRTSDQHELDLVLDFGKELWAVEVKLTASPSTADMDRLSKTADMVGASRRILVLKTSRTTGDANRMSCDLPALLESLQAASR